MTDFNDLESASKAAEAILGTPFEWCFIKGGTVTLIDASDYGGTKGGVYPVNDFAMAKFFVTNSQYQKFYQKFIDHPNGFYNLQWWTYSSEGILWRRDHRHPKPTAFAGADLPVTRVSWFESMAFCNWFSAELKATVRLPTEQEWQRAAVGDSDWSYPWGNTLDETRANFANHVGSTSRVGSFPAGQSPFGVMDMIGNLWEWCLTLWGTDNVNPGSYAYRATRGGAWNVSNPEYLRAIDRGTGQPPRSRLNDAGFRVMLHI